MVRVLTIISLLVGLVLLVPTTFDIFFPALSRSDVSIALEPIAKFTLPDKAHAEPGEFSLSIPDSPIWKRIWRLWGYPGFVIAVQSPDGGRLFCMDASRISVRESASNDILVITRPESPLYGYSPDCRGYGWFFMAEPGTRVTISVDLGPQTLPASGNLIVGNYWTFAVKDLIVGSDLRNETMSISNACAWAGMVLLIVALGIYTFGVKWPLF